MIDAAGDILYRQGIPGAARLVPRPRSSINPGFPSRDIAVVTTSTGPVLASVDAQRRRGLALRLARRGFVRIGSLTTGQLPAQIIAADLNGDGLSDLVVRNAGDGTLSVFFGTKFDSTVPVPIPWDR